MSGDVSRPESSGIAPPRADSARSDAQSAWPPLADAPPARGDAGEGTMGDAPAEPRAPRRPNDRPPVDRWSAPLSDVELPPPELVPFADTRPEPITGPIRGPVRPRALPPERFEPGMRGGLAASRPAPAQDRGRDSAGTLTPAPLQPMWDTPAEFPLPVMPDPRPMPADAGGPAAAPGRRWTRRGVGIAAVVALALIGAVTLARMERAPDTTAELMRPETPIGYGGDVALDSPAVASPSDTSLLGPTSARAGGNAARRGAAAAGGSAPAPAPSTAPAPIGAAPRANAPNARAAQPPAAQPRQPAGRAATPATTTPRAGTTNRSAPTTPNRSTAAAATPPRASEPAAPAPTVAAAAATAERPSGACGSPALADQRACLASHIDRNDAALNETYGDVIVAMRRRASSAPGDPDPPEVQRLRAAQRSWLLRRDAECRRRGRGREGPLWATPRAQCLAEFSAERGRDLAAMLGRLQRN
jgi:uncharacterized protein YecT (DUF1311 family)